MFALALPIFDQSGRVAYVMSCSWLSSDKPFDESAIAADMRDAVADIHRLTLARVPVDF